MSIDGFTVLAQMVNFLVLVWLLRRFLYQPVLDALDERRRRIEGELASAARREAEAERERATLQERNAEFERGRAERLLGVQTEAEALRLRLTEEAREAVARLQERWTRRLAEERTAWRQAVADSAGRELLELSRQVLQDLADTGLEQAMVRAFLREAGGLSEAERASWRAMVREGDPQMFLLLKPRQH